MHPDLVGACVRILIFKFKWYNEKVKHTLLMLLNVSEWDSENSALIEALSISDRLMNELGFDDQIFKEILKLEGRFKRKSMEGCIPLALMKVSTLDRILLGFILLYKRSWPKN